MSPARITIRRPDDWHLHLRDGAMLAAVLPFTARQFARAIVMPNLVPPVTTVAAARAYRERILAALPPHGQEGSSFQPLMTCYLGDATDPDEVEAGWNEGVFTAVKLYPAHATTNSQFGVTDIRRVHPVLERLQRLGMPLLMHGEVTNHDVDIFDREAVFIERVLDPVRRDFPDLRIVFEHITTEDAVAYVEGAHAGSGTPRLGATITAHHLVINRNAIFAGGIRPHLYCLPIAKREKHRLALRRAATSGHPAFFLGTDSAPHTVGAKENACGCAGIFTAPTALETYVSVFDEEGALPAFEAFAALNGPRFYGLPLNEGTVTLEKMASVTPEAVEVGGDRVLPFETGEPVQWAMVAT
jgi:dihydroorotase